MGQGPFPYWESSPTVTDNMQAVEMLSYSLIPPTWTMRSSIDLGPMQSDSYSTSNDWNESPAPIGEIPTRSGAETHSYPPAHKACWASRSPSCGIGWPMVE